MRRPTRLPPARAAAFARALELDLGGGICHACLSFVSVAIDRGDRVEIMREVRRMTPDLWSDGLAEQALRAVRQACEDGVPDAQAALVDLLGQGGRSTVAQAIVYGLACELSRRTKIEMKVEAAARARPPPAPDLN